MRDIKGTNGLISGINVTPMVDVVLVLLVVLMVTATTLARQSLPLELPRAASSEATPTLLSVSIDRQGRSYLDGTAVSPDELREHVRRVSQSNTEVRVSLAADGGTEHRSVIGIMDLLRQEHVTRFAISVAPGEPEHH